MTITIAGPAGALEASYHEAAQSRNAALLCHPHPSYGGSMHDGVLSVATSALDRVSAESATNSWSHLRFNFRGVGASAGRYDDGRGEQDDLVAAWEWLRAQSNWDQLLLIGYSFGSAMAWSARQRCLDISGLLLIAPPTAAMPFLAQPAEAEGKTPGPVASNIPSHIIVGEQDTYCDQNMLPAGAKLTLLPESDHFFSGATQALESAIRQAVE